MNEAIVQVVYYGFSIDMIRLIKYNVMEKNGRGAAGKQESRRV